MPRKSTAAELQAEEAAVNSPVRRSSRIVSGNGSTPAGVAKRRTSQSTEPQAGTPARATRGRRASAQSAQETEEKVETKPVTRTRRASMLAEEEATQKDALTPTRRGRKPSVDIEETEKPKPLRGRRTSTASKNEEADEEKPVKTTAVRSRRSSANVEVEAEAKVAPKTPARTTSRRRSSVTENAAAEEVPTPAKRTTRGRKASDAETTEEVKKPAARRGRKASTDDVLTKTPPKTPGRTRRASINKEVEIDELLPTKESDNLETPKAYPSNDIDSNEEEMSPIFLKDLAVKVTPLKKRKIVEKVEAELDLSIINESSDDINSSKHDESAKEDTKSETENVLTGKSIHDLQTTNMKSDQTTSLPSTKGLASESIDMSSPRKSPRLTEKLSKNNTPKEGKVSVIGRPRNLIKENDKEPSVTEQSLLSSGSDGSFNFHLSNISLVNSSRPDSNKESTQGEILNTSKDSTGSNKENIEIADSLNTKDGLDDSVVSPVSEPKVVLARISNVFKPNQKEYSFMEPMEIDENSLCFNTSVIDKSSKLNDSLARLNQKVLEKVQSSEVTTNYVTENNSDLDESIEFNQKTFKITKGEETAELLKEVIPDQPKSPKVLSLLATAEDALKHNLPENEGSDTNLLIEETPDRVDFSIKPKTKNIEISTSSIAQRISKSPTSTDASLIINQPLEQVQVVLSGKSSSPIRAKRRSASFRKSKSPIPDEANSTESESDEHNRLSVARSTRKSKSLTKSPSKTENNEEKTVVTRRSKSKSVSPNPNKRIPHPDKEEVKQSHLSVGGRSASKSPDSTGISIDNDPEDSDDKVVSQKSKSKSLSPIKGPLRSPSFMLGTSGNKLNLERSTQNVDSLNVSRRSKSKSKSPSPGKTIPDVQKTPLARDIKESRTRRSDGSSSKSPLPVEQESSVHKSTETLKRKSSVSKSPLPEVLALDQSFEKPKGLDEILVNTEQKYMKRSFTVETANVEGQNSSVEKLPGGTTTNLSKISENEIDVSGSNNTISEHTNIQDKTEYHTAIASTNNESDFNSLLNTDIEIGQSHIKDTESTHYDFDLDSDDDDLHSKNESKVACIIGKPSPKLDNEYENPSQDVIEPESSKRKSVTSETEKSQSTEFNEVSGLNTNKPSEKNVLDQDDIFEENDHNLHKDLSSVHDNITWPIKSSSCESLGDKISLDKEAEGTPNESHGNNKGELLNMSVELEDEKDDVTTMEKGALDKDDEKEKSLDSACKENIAIADKSIFNENLQEDSADLCSKERLDECIEDFKEAENKYINKNQKDKEQTTDRKEDCISSDEDIKESSLRRTKKTHKESDHADNTSVVESKDDYEKINQERKEVDVKESKHRKRSAGLKDSPKTEIKNDVEEVNTSLKKAKEDKNIQKLKTKPSLEEFASAKLDEYLSSKGSELEDSGSEEEAGEEEESEEEYNEFIDGMAEEGEEDTPSEDSNQIVDEGESIGFSSEREDTDDDYDPDDSFICDDEVTDLLSGDEFDLEDKKKKTKKSRIIDANKLGDEDIIKIPGKKKKVTEEPKKRSRIITVSDSSEEDQEPNESRLKEQSPKEDKERDSKLKEQSPKEDVEKEEERMLSRSVILIEDSIDNSSNVNLIEDSVKEHTSKSTAVKESKDGNTTDINNITEEFKVENLSKSVLMDGDIDKSNVTEITIEPLPVNASMDNLNTSIQKRHRKSSLSIQENILVDGVKDPLITKRISTLVESFCSTVKKGEVSLNLSLEFEDTGEKDSQEKDKTESVHVLSNITICPGYPLVSQEEKLILEERKGALNEKEEVLEVQENSTEKESLSASLNDVVDLREFINRKNLKRRLSKSLDEMNEEVKASKRRKQDKNKHRENQKEKTSRATITKTKKKDKAKEDVAKALRKVIASSSIMDQLITDVKNRPRRTIKPSQSGTEVESFWTTTKVTNLKPSTSAVTKEEKIKIPTKLHPKDFKNQMLSDNKRIKRVDTKTLLKKKGAY